MLDFAAATHKWGKTVRSIQKIAKMSGYDTVPVPSFEDIVESDVELDDSVVVEPDNDPPLEIEKPVVDISEENIAAGQILKSRAMDAVLKGKLDVAVNHLTEAITLNPKSASLYASRASVFVKLKKPNAAIRDADAGIEISLEFIKGYKARGLARAMLGLWEGAYDDLNLVANFDFDEEAFVMLKKVEHNLRKIEEHRQKYDRLRKERELMIKMELEKQRRQVKSDESEAANVLRDGQVIEILSTHELREKLNAARRTSRLSVLYFTATWSGPCHYISPKFSGMAENYPKVVFLKLDIDKLPIAAAEYNVSAIPSFFFIKNGGEVDNFTGVDIDALEMKIAQHAV